MILDIHTHRAAPCPQAVISTEPSQFDPVPGQLYSVGLHPWTGGRGEADFGLLERCAASPQAAAIGECGLDPLRGDPMFRQLQVFRRHVELSERLRKPLVIHAVKSADILAGLHRDLRPSQPWAVHGFRGKPGAAAQLLRAGLMLSFGPQFNAATVAAVPPGMLLAETDDSGTAVEDVIAALSAAAGRGDLTAEIAAAAASFLGGACRTGSK